MDDPASREAALIHSLTGRFIRLIEEKEGFTQAENLTRHQRRRLLHALVEAGKLEVPKLHPKLINSIAAFAAAEAHHKQSKDEHQLDDGAMAAAAANILITHRKLAEESLRYYIKVANHQPRPPYMSLTLSSILHEVDMAEAEQAAGPNRKLKEDEQLRRQARSDHPTHQLRL